MTKVVLPPPARLFHGFREIETRYYGTPCNVCGEKIEACKKVMWNSTTKEMRHINCHFEHPQNLREVWLAVVTRENDESGETDVWELPTIISTMHREAYQSGLPGTGSTTILRLIRQLDILPKDAKVTNRNVQEQYPDLCKRIGTRYEYEQSH